VSSDDTRQRVLCRVSTLWHSAKKPLCRVPAVGSRQRLTAVSFGTAADGPLPRAPFAECLTLGKHVFAECRPMPSVQHSVKGLFVESLTLPSAAFFAECRTKGTRQRIQHSAKPRIPVVPACSPSTPAAPLAPSPTPPVLPHRCRPHLRPRRNCPALFSK
jgi:hypothetical protein